MKNIYRPIMVHGMASDVMAAVLYFPNLLGDGGVKSFFFLTSATSASSSVGFLLEMANERIDPNRH